MFKQLIIYTFIFIFYSIVTSSENSYGEFNLVITNLKTCKGPKHEDCSIISGRMHNTSNLLYHVQIFKNLLPGKGKIVVIANGKPLVRLQMKKPCDHLFIGPLLKEIFNNNDCIFKKGNYSLNLNIEELTQKYYGGMFLYGNVTFKTVLYNDACNFVCNIAEVEIVPKKKTK